jgi:Tol biopolymer transport system component
MCQKNFNCKYDIYSMKANGNNVIRLTTDGTSSFPAWSPDGSLIAFSNSRTGQREIYAMNADGSGQTQLTNNGKRNTEPDWSPDGTQIVFRDFDSSNFIEDLFVMNADGSDVQQLTHNPGFAFSLNPAWSPDRTRIAFWHVNPDGNGGIYTMYADGSHVKLIPGTALGLQPSWQPLAVPTVLVYPGSGPAGSAATVTVAHFQAGEKVKLVFTAPTGNTSLGKATANSFGYASRQVTIPAGAAPGKHKIKATGLTSGLSASVTFVVT